MSFRFVVLFTLASFGTAACATETEGEAPVDTLASEIGSCVQIDEEQVEHACLHGGAGPFREVTASTVAPPDVSREHTSYRVTLSQTAAGTFGGAVTFVPPETGEFAMYTSSVVPRIRIDGAAGPVRFDCSTAVPTTLCGPLRRLRVADLTEGSPVTLTFQASSARSVILVIEHAEEHDHEDGHDH